MRGEGLTGQQSKDGIDTEKGTSNQWRKKYQCTCYYSVGYDRKKERKEDRQRETVRQKRRAGQG